ncbi:hypothetical protein F443_07159 [Phytophthora nicotianae P1569]|uniref:Uncharacterized protein n=3 Tax=Phytophthora nicotianae TaxID=4792 RepID=V9FBN0_PHYNI|nr:hypothetical protein F443_07159 [Phytophthora nicotianae P1569]ETO77591.1 hypothetical protein F444_07229 [Phytophthora nicotianae P1976]
MITRVSSLAYLVEWDSQKWRTSSSTKILLLGQTSLRYGKDGHEGWIFTAGVKGWRKRGGFTRKPATWVRRSVSKATPVETMVPSRRLGVSSLGLQERNLDLELRGGCYAR